MVLWLTERIVWEDEAAALQSDGYYDWTEFTERKMHRCLSFWHSLMYFLLPAHKVPNNVEAAEAFITSLMSWKDKTTCLHTELDSLHSEAAAAETLQQEEENCVSPSENP